MRVINFRLLISTIAVFSLLLAGVVFEPGAQKAQAQSSTALANDFDYAADFNGANYLKSAVNAQVIPSTKKYTVEAWINPKPHSGTDSYKTIVSQNQDNEGADAGRFFLALHWDTTAKIYEIHLGLDTNSYDFTLEQGVPVNAWSHIAVVVGDSTTAVYFNGQELGTAASASGAGNSVGFTIGATAGTPTHFFNGQIDQVKVWNKNIDVSAEITKSMHAWANEPGIKDGANAAAALLAHYDFNDKSAASGKVFDRTSTTGYHLDINGSVDFTDVKNYQELNGKQIFTFPRSYLTKNGGWKAPLGATSMNALVVGGGGSGGWAFGWNSGGGGGGEVVELTNQVITAGSNIQVVVAQGGVSHKPVNLSSSGQKSILKPTSAATALAEARGGGAGATNSVAGKGASDGFFTGGGGSTQASVAGIARGTGVTANQNGGNASSNGGVQPSDVQFQAGGGGGGAGGAGENATQSAAGAGGIGVLPTNPEFSRSYFGGGGGGGRRYAISSTAAKGGIGGGGAGGLASYGTSATPNTGGGGGGAGGGDGSVDGASSGGNGGSGLVIISVELVGRCMFGTGGFTVNSVPKIRHFSLGFTGVDSTFFSDPTSSAAIAAFYAEPVILGDRIYLADRGRGKLKSIGLDGSGPTYLGSLPTPGLGVTADERYVYAWNSTGIARYDTQTGVYEQSFIRKGDIPKVDGEIAFVRFKGIGYLFIANNQENASGSQYSRVHAVPISGINPSTGAAIVPPVSISNSLHLFSESMLQGTSDLRGSSGLAVIGETIYWTTMAGSGKADGTIWAKKMTTANMPYYPGGGNGLTQLADRRLFGNQLGLRSLSADGNKLYFQTTRAVSSIDVITGNLKIENSTGTGETLSNGTQPVASCALAPTSVEAVLTSTGDITIEITSKHAASQGLHYYEYRLDGGPWVSAGFVGSTRTLTFRPPAGTTGFLETRVATAIGTDLSEYTYSAPIELGGVPKPLCSDPTELIYEVPAATKVQFRLTSAGDPVTVGWGNGAVSNPYRWTGGYTFAYTYNQAGTYTIQICGKFAGMGDPGLPQYYLKAVKSWGAARDTLTKLSYAFKDAKILTDVPAELPANTTQLDATFLNATIFNDPDVSLWDTSKVTTFRSAFSGAKAFNQNLGNWDVSSAQTFEAMFQLAGVFNNGGVDSIKNWDTSSATSMRYMFEATSAFNRDLKARTFNSTGAVTAATSTDGTSSVKEVATLTFTGTFADGDILRFKNVATAPVMVALTTEQVATVTTVAAAVKTALDAAAGAKYDITQADGVLTLTAKNIGDLANLMSLKQATAWDVSKVVGFGGMFLGASLFNSDIANWVTTSATDMSSMFQNAIKFDKNLGGWNVSNVTNFSSMFYNAADFNNGGVDSIKNWNTAKATFMGGMFAYTKKFNQPLTAASGKWNVDNVQAMQNMFLNATAFNQLVDWDTVNVTNMQQMFMGTSGLKQVPVLRIDKVTNAANMFSYSGLTDDQYGLVVTRFANEYQASRAQSKVSFGAFDKTALCNTPQESIIFLSTATDAATNPGAGWVISDKTNRTIGFCTPQVTITAKAGSHVYGGPLPAIGYDLAVSNGSLPTSDWLNDVTCRAVAVSGGAAVTTTSAAAVVSTKSGDTVTGTYKTVCTGPTGTGLGINVTYKDNVYSIAKRPISVRAVDRAVFAGQALLSTTAKSSDLTPAVIVTAGSILAGDVVNYSLTFTSAANGASDNGTVYAGNGTYSITPALSTGDATANYVLAPVTGAQTGTLTVTTKTYIISAKTQTKVYGEQKTFTSDDWACVVRTGSQAPYTQSACTESLTVALSSDGSSSSASVGEFPIIVGTVTGLDGVLVEKVNADLIVKKRLITVTPNSKTVTYGSAAPNYDFNLMSSEFRNGNGANTITGITCTSAYSNTAPGQTPRGSVLPITCSGGSSDYYELNYLDSNLTVLEDSLVTKDVPQEIMLGEEDAEADALFSFELSPVSEICFANLVIYSGEEEPLISRVEVKPGLPVEFSNTLIEGDYDYDLRVDGNCSIAPTSGQLRIVAYEAPEPEPEPEPEPAPSSGGNAVLVPNIESLSERQLPANRNSKVVVRGQRLDMVTEVTVGGIKVNFTIAADGTINLDLPALKPGTYEMVVHHTYGSLTYPGAFTIGGSSTPISGGQAIPNDKAKSRTLRFTNFAGDGFRLPSSARAGITRVFTAIGVVDRVICRGITSARIATAADQKLAENRAREACNLAKRLAPTASIELRTSPAAGIGAKFRAVNLFIVYSLD